VGFVRCDYCNCECEKPHVEKDIKLSEKPVARTEKEIFGTCKGYCTQKGLVRTNAFGCSKVKDCWMEKAGWNEGFVRCDYCQCTCVTQKHAASYELDNVRYYMDDAKMIRGKPIIMGRTIIANKGTEKQRIRRSLSFGHVSESSVSSSHKVEFGLKIEVTAGMKVGGSGTDVNIAGSINKGFTYTAGEKGTESKSDTIMVEAYVDGGYKKEVLIVGYRMQVDIPYTADLKITYEDDSVEVIKTNGLYTGVDMGEFHVEYNKSTQLTEED